MRKFTMFFGAMLFAVSAYSQSVKFTVPEIEVTYKRCIANGPSAYIDVLITNWGSKDISGSCISEDNMMDYSSHVTVVYDDEGNVYKPNYGISSIKIGENSFVPSLAPEWFALPSGVPVKCRVRLTGVDEFATEFKLLKIAFRDLDSGTPYGAALLEVRDIPITRQ